MLLCLNYKCTFEKQVKIMYNFKKVDTYFETSKKRIVNTYFGIKGVLIITKLLPYKNNMLGFITLIL